MAIKLSQRGDGVYELDVKGYACPHPQLYALKSLEKLQPGCILEVIYDNPSSQESIAIAVGKKGYKIIENSSDGGVFKIKIEK